MRRNKSCISAEAGSKHNTRYGYDLRRIKREGLFDDKIFR